MEGGSGSVRSVAHLPWSGAGGRPHDARRKSVTLGAADYVRAGSSPSSPREQRRRSTHAPLPPSLASSSPPPPLPTPDFAPPAPPPKTPVRPSAIRSVSSSSVSSSGTAHAGLPRKVSFDDRPSVPRSSTSRSSLSAASVSSTRRRSSAAAPVCSGADGPDGRRASTFAMRHNRPISSIFPTTRRPASVQSSTYAPSTAPEREGPLAQEEEQRRRERERERSLRSLSSKSSSLLSHELASASEGEQESELAVQREEEEQMEEEEGVGPMAFGVEAPPHIGASQMDALADGMGRAALAGHAEEERQKQRQRRRRRREDSGALSEWSILSASPKSGGRASPFAVAASSGDESRTSRSRETSDASFASLNAQPTSAQLAAPLLPSPDEPEGYVDYDMTGAPSMARQETLKAIERPWMATLVAGGGANGPRTVEELREAYRAGGAVHSPSAGEGLLASPTRGSQNGRRKSLFNTPSTPPNGIRELSLSPSPSPSSRPRRSLTSSTPAASERESSPPTPTPPVPVVPPPPPTSSPSPPALLPYVPFPSPPPDSLAPPDPQTPSRIKSIDEIIAQHAPTSYLANRRPSASPSVATSAAPSESARDVPRARQISAQTTDSADTSTSADSLAAEIRHANDAQGALLVEDLAPDELPSSSLPTPLPPATPSSAVVIPAVDALLHDDGTSSVHSSVAAPHIHSPRSADGDAQSHEREIARLLRSPRLTRLFTLRRPSNAGLTVSLADVGSPSGYPVLVFLGLGSIRYLVQLYDELADALGLRLICFDRWGLGRTTDVPDSQRGFVEWSSVVAELVSAEHLNLSSFSILAHSAGAPYAVASALHGELTHRVRGSVHLLAPWVSTSADSLAGMYKYLKFVPSSVLKTAQAAEWKMQSWRLGKPPSLAHAPVGWDAKTGRLMNGEELQRQEEEDERRAEANQGVLLASSPTNARKLSTLYPDGALIKAGPEATPPAKSKGFKASFGGFFNGGSSSPKQSPTGSSHRNSLFIPSPSSRRTSFFGGSSRSTPPPEYTGSPASVRTLAPSGVPGVGRRSSVLSDASPLPSPTTPTTPNRRESVLHPASSPAFPPSPGIPPPSFRERMPSIVSNLSSGSRNGDRPTIPPAALIDGLLRASHAESLRGGTSDLLVLLERTSAASVQGDDAASVMSGSGGGAGGSKKGLGFAYRDLPVPVKVWYGDRDDRISLSSIRWLERELDRGVAGIGGKGCEVRIVEGADHGLMANHRVMVEVLDSIAHERQSH